LGLGAALIRSDDIVCEALVQSDEDVTRAVELLLSAAFASKAARKKKERKERQATTQEAVPTQAEAAGHAAGNEELQPEQLASEEPARPKTATEREAARLRKKLREIERIEERLARGEKVDPLQLPKLDKKHEVELELIEADRRVQQEEHQRLEEQRQEERRQQEERQARELAAQEEAARKEFERRERAMRLEREQRQMLETREREERDAREAATAAMWEADAARAVQLKAPLTPAPQHPVSMPLHTAPQREQEASMPQQAKGMELLSMLQTAQPGSEHGYQQSKQMADKLSGGRGHVLVGHGGGKGAASGASGNGYPQTAYRGSPHGASRQRNEAFDHKLLRPEDPPRSKPEQSHQDWYQQGQPQQRAGGFNQEQSEHAQHPRDPGQKEPAEGRWAEEKPAPDERSGSGNADDFATIYSTELDVSKISIEKQREAERIAKEIEGTTRRAPDDYRHGQDDHSRPKKGAGAKGCGKAKWDGGGRGNRHRQGYEPAQRWS